MPEDSEDLSSLLVKAVRPYLDVQGPGGVSLAAEAVSLLATEGPSRAVCNAFQPSGALSPFPFLQLVSALHNLTRHVVYRGLTRAEDILSLFPEKFHQNLKNLLTKIILENM